MEWVPIPNTFDGSGYRALIQSEHGPEIFAAWILMLELASKGEPRGTLTRRTGQPHTTISMANATGLPEEIFRLALERLISEEIGWISIQEIKKLGNHFPPNAQEKKIAHGRINRDLEKGIPIATPFGPISIRPDICQWCKRKSQAGARQTAATIAHHLEGYGNLTADRYVIFVCRSCHQLFEHNKITLEDVKARISQVSAETSQIPALNGMEGNGTEEKGKNKRTQVSAPETIVSGEEKDDDPFDEKQALEQAAPAEPPVPVPSDEGALKARIAEGEKAGDVAAVLMAGLELMAGHPFACYPKEWKAAHQVEEKIRRVGKGKNPLGFLRGLLQAYLAKRKASKQEYWRDAPLSPSAINVRFDQILGSVQKLASDAQGAQIVSDFLKERQAR